MVEIIPALMPEDIEDIEQYARELKGCAKTMQLDVMDGRFVPESTWPYNTAGDAHFDRIVESAEALPLWKDMDYEIDLMIDHPEAEIDKWRSVGAKRLIFHIESIRDPETFFENELFHGSRSEFLEVGLAINIDTPLEAIEPYLIHADFVQCMGIARIGYQGEEFDERVLHTVKTLRERHPELIISIDGGVNLETAPRLIEAGANRLVSGSAILNSEDPQEAIRTLESLS